MRTGTQPAEPSGAGCFYAPLDEWTGKDENSNGRRALQPLSKSYWKVKVGEIKGQLGCKPLFITSITMTLDYQRKFSCYISRIRRFGRRVERSEEKSRAEKSKEE